MLKHSFSVVACLLFSCLLIGVAQSLGAATIAQAPETTDDEQLTQQLLGRWELYQHSVIPPFGVTPVLIFAPHGNLFYLEQPEDEIAIVHSSWSLDTSQSIIETNLGVLVTGKFLGPDLMELSIEEPVSSDNDLPVIYARRVESDILRSLPIDSFALRSLPGGAPIVEPTDFFGERVARARESEASIHISAVNRFQQAALLEYTRFETNIQTIARQIGGEGGKLLQSENYDYMVHLSTDGNVVSTIAIPKHDDLRAFVGRVSISIDSFSNSTLVDTLCQSTSPTDQMPDLPDDTGACPTGYVAVD